ncbi:hypothetical protein [Stenotrophomonas oahuensis]|uniref:Holin n=1 Tax=Stenotrophomonas oahuensis TaxID=3003271 RepID=A0ABY9YNK5_9GAMM|nr:hypothetical protein [Stenotrophomonas sp. A5586]WNH52446.1 hypothetical protein PDM29_19340 [Stenotrophomonas sp. A5586]
MLSEITSALSKVNEVPREVWSVAAGILAGFGLTQRIRRLLPDKWDDKSHEVATQAVVFLVAFSVTFATWGGKDADANVAALVTALVTPALWNAFLAGLGWWKPALRDALLARPVK